MSKITNRRDDTEGRKLNPLSGIEKDGNLYKLAGIRPDGYYFIPLSNELEPLVIDPFTLAKSEADGDIIVNDIMFEPDGRLAGVRSIYKPIVGLSHDEICYLLWMRIWVEHLISCRKKGKVPLSHVKLTKWAQQEKPILDPEIEKALLPTGVAPVKRSGKRRTTWDPPGATTLREAHNRYVESRFNPLKLLKNPSRMGGQPIHPEVVAAIRSKGDELAALHELHASEKRFSISGLVELVRGKIHELNATRPLDDQLSYPAWETVEKYARDMPLAAIIAKQRGKDIARNKLALVERSPTVSRIGERVEADCWNAEVMTLFKGVSIWALVPKDVQAVLEPRRVIISGLEECASKIIIGLAFGFSENTTVTRAALRMGVSDKSLIAHAVGSKAGWWMQTGIESLVTDGGKGYRGFDYVYPALCLTKNYQFAAGDYPKLRGRIERFWQTFAKQFLQYFTGRTFSDILEKAGYDPEKRASVYVDEFCKLATLYVLDYYHLRGHRGLNGQSPSRRWQALAAKTGYRPTPDEDELRMIFGLELTRTANHEGLRWMNVQYTRSIQLERMLFNKGPRKVPIKVDPLNMGRISARLGGRWYTVAGPPEMDGVKLSEWVAHNRDLARQYGEEQALDFPIVAAAMRKFLEVTHTAERAAGLLDIYMTAEEIERLEGEMRLQIVYDRPASQYGDTPSISKGTLGKEIPTNTYQPPANPVASPKDDQAAVPARRWKSRRN